MINQQVCWRKYQDQTVRAPKLTFRLFGTSLSFDSMMEFADFEMDANSLSLLSSTLSVRMCLERCGRQGASCRFRLYARGE